MNQSNQELFNLIHSLTKSEQRYFKLFIKNLGAKSTNYERLFKAIAQQKEYDEHKIRRKFRGEKLLSNLSASKQYLQGIILKALRNYHSEKTIDDTILDGIRTLKILNNKGLFSLLKKEIERLEKLARTYHRSFYLPVILYWKHTTQYALLFDKKVNSIEQFEAIVEEIPASVEALELGLRQFVDLLHLKFNYQKTGIVQPNVGTLLPKSDGFVENLTYLNKQIEKDLYVHNWLGALESNKKALQLLEQDNKRLTTVSEWQDSYHAILTTSIFVASNGVFVQDFYEFTQTYDALPTESVAPIFQIFAQSSKMIFYRKTGRVAEGKALLENIQIFLKKHTELANNNFIPVIYFNTGIIYLFDKEYDKALELLQNSASILKKQKAYPELYLATFVIEMIIFYEKKEFLFLDSLIQAFVRKLNKTEPLFDYWKLLVTLFKLLNRQEHNLEEIQPSLMAIKEQLKDFHEEQHLLRYFIFIDWIESLVSEKEMLQVVQLQVVGN
ncbi:MAG: hypothetical protein ACRBFS_03530 [Aureispira sp.]